MVVGTGHSRKLASSTATPCYRQLISLASAAQDQT